MGDGAVFFAICHQLIVVAGSDYGAVLEYQDQVCMTEAADPLGNENSGGVPILLTDGFSQLGICLIVQGGGGVVQNQNFGIGSQRPGDEQTLLLSAG